MPGRDRTSQHDEASWLIQHFELDWETTFFIFLIVFILSALKSPPLCFFPSFFFSQLVGLSSFGPYLGLPGTIYSESVLLPWNDGNQFSQEIRTTMTSWASSSGLIRPIWTADKRKDFCPSCLPLKSCGKKKKKNLPPPQLFYWCSLFLRGGWEGKRKRRRRGGGRQGGCGCLEACAGWVGCWPLCKKTKKKHHFLLPSSWFLDFSKH